MGAQVVPFRLIVCPSFTQLFLFRGILFTGTRITDDWIHGWPDDRSGQSIPLFAGARVEFRGRRKTTLEAAVFNLKVLRGVIVLLVSSVFVAVIVAMGAAVAIIMFLSHGFPLSRRLLGRFRHSKVTSQWLSGSKKPKMFSPGAPGKSKHQDRNSGPQQGETSLRGAVSGIRR
jgi:hypothetical protein